MPRSKSKNWYERLDKDTQAIVLGVGFIIFLLLLVFVLSNPILAAVIFVVFGLLIFTIYAKYKTGNWWWRSSTSKPTSQASAPSNPSQVDSQPMMMERETVTREVFMRKCSHCGANVTGTRVNCPNCGGIL